MTKTMRKLILFMSIIVILASMISGILFVDLIHKESIVFVISALLLFTIGLFFARKWFGQLLIWLAFIALFILVFTNPRFWLFLLVMIVGAASLWKGVLLHTQQRFDDIQLAIVQQSKVDKHARVQKAYWLQERKMLASTYEWDDIHLMAWFGDTTIHLGNTILPEEKSVIAIQKAIGYIRIIVPIGIGISLSHSTISGNVLFEGELYTLKNEQLSVYSENYMKAKRQIKIMTTVYFGDIEVVRI